MIRRPPRSTRTHTLSLHDALPISIAPFSLMHSACTPRPAKWRRVTPGYFVAIRMWLQRLGSSDRSEEHTSELQSLMRISYAVFCLKKKKNEKYVKNNKLR